jgi:membrane-bound acyltransferase YfiQ involved in biofilm formation
MLFLGLSQKLSYINFKKQKLKVYVCTRFKTHLPVNFLWSSGMNGFVSKKKKKKKKSSFNDLKLSHGKTRNTSPRVMYT